MSNGSSRAVVAPIGVTPEVTIVNTRNEGISFGSYTNLAGSAIMTYQALRNNLDVYTRVQQSIFDWEVQTAVAKRAEKKKADQLKAKERMNFSILEQIGLGKIEASLGWDIIQGINGNYIGTRGGVE